MRSRKILAVTAIAMLRTPAMADDHATAGAK